MTNRFISALGSNTSPYTSWATAASSTTTALSDVIAVMAAGDALFIDKTANILNTAAKIYGIPGTSATPSQIYSATNTGTTPVAADLVAGAQITQTGSSGLTFTGWFYAFGLTLNSGTLTNSSTISFDNVATTEQVWDTCQFVGLASGTLSIAIGSTAGACKISWLNSSLTVNAGTASQITLNDSSTFRWRNGSLLGTQTAIANLFAVGGLSIANAFIEGVDLSLIASGKNIVAASNAAGIIQLKNCKIASGALLATPTFPALTIDAVLCDSAGTGYKQSRRTYQGSLDASTTVYNNATDGVTPISWTVVTSANDKRQSPFECFVIVQWVAAGTYAASTIMATSATASLTNADISVDTEYMASAASPIASLVSSAPATLLTAGSSLAAGSWAAGGLGNNYKLAIPSFTVAIDGYVSFTVKVAKASLTINVDPAVTVA